jgi:hypothetical protein
MSIAKHTYRKLNQDIGKSKFNPEVYYEGRNIRIITNEEFGNVTNEKGNIQVLTLPVYATNPTDKPNLNDIDYPLDYLNIVGHTVINETLVLLATGNDVFAVFTVDKSYSITLKFLDSDLNIPDDVLLDVKGFYENENIQKVYWADGVNELRYLNIVPDNLNLDKNFISTVPNTELTTPIIDGFVNGGSHTSGMIQYAYNLYNLNGSQTKISPLSHLFPLNNGDKGDQVNTSVSKSPRVRIDGIDNNYEYFKVYSIKYSSLNSTPEIKVIFDEVVTTSSFTFIDDNNSPIQEITFDEFIFLGADVYKPTHINIKDNHMFLANYKTESFDVDFDTRAYSADNTGSVRIIDVNNNELIFDINDIPDIAEKHDAINPSIKAEDTEPDYNKYIFNDDNELGGTGPNVKYRILKKIESVNINGSSMQSNPTFATEQNPVRLLSLKTGETYRLGLEFRNRKGQWSFSKWMADVKIPEIATLDNNPFNAITNDVAYTYVQVELLNVPADENIVSWRVIIVDRTEADKTIVTQGFINPVIKDEISPGFTVYPSFFTRTFRDTPRIPNYLVPSNDAVNPSQDIREYILPMRYNAATDAEKNISMNDLEVGDIRFTREILADPDSYLINNEYHTFHSPEVVKNKSNLNIGAGDQIRFIGLVRNNFSRSSREIYGPDGLLLTATRANPATLSFSATETHPGATILAQFSFDPPVINPPVQTRNRIAGSKFIGAYNFENSNDVHLYSNLKYSFVRYFGGYIHINAQTTARTFEIQDPVPYIAPIEGARNFTLGGTEITFESNMRIVTRFNNDIAPIRYRATTFRAYGGSSLLLHIPDITTRFANLSGGDYLPMIEIFRKNINQYGGNTFTARQRNRYRAYSDSASINETVLDGYQGDTYMQKFNYLKVFKSEDGKRTLSEIVSVPLESSINLDMRYDILKDRPDNKDADELTSYGFNSVYEQTNNTIKGITKPANFRELNVFNNEIIPSKSKIPGEEIDSFTEFLVNDRKSLDGKFGPITALEEYKDNLYSFQRNAIAYLAINPRVQISATDGIPIELGTGRLIERYNYITTNSGTLNKWSVARSKNGIMYFDLLNKSINFLGGESGATEISTVNGLYNKLKTLSDVYYNDLLQDKPLINRGVIAAYDNNTEDVYFTFHTAGNSFTVAYNGLVQGFTSFYDFLPNNYVMYDGKMVTLHDNTLWEHGNPSALYNTFYGIYHPSSITLISNDNPDFNKIFDNIHYNSEFYINNLEVSNVTFNKIRLWNEYQNTGDFSFNFDLYTKQIKKRFRKWNFIIPRNQGTRDRIMNNWVFLKMEFDKRILPQIATPGGGFDYELDMELGGNPASDNFRFVLNDLLISYTPKP